MALVLFFIVAMLILAVVYLAKKNRLVTVARPVLGMLPDLLHNATRLHDLGTKILRKNGGTFEFDSPVLDFVITCDPLNIQHILSANFANYPKGSEFSEMFDFLGDGILCVDSELWRFQRRMFHLWNRRQSKHELVSRTIRRKVGDDLIPFLDHVSETGIQVDLQDVFEKIITFDIAISLIFGLNVGSHDFKSSKAMYLKAYEDIQATVFNRHIIPRSIWKLQRWLQFGGEQKYGKALKIFDEFMYKCVALKRDKAMEEEDELDMISVYMEENEKPYSDKFLKDVALNFTAASRDTLTSLLTWFFWLVSTHPSVEANILKEMNEKLAENNHEQGFLGAEDLSKLVYLQAALNETLRLYPAVPFNHKTALEADILPSGHRVKAKKRVLISFYAMGRMENIWGQDCSEFRPERWFDSEHGNRLVYVPSHKFPVFNVGPRTCLGKDMALIMAKVVAIEVLRKFSLSVVEGHSISPSLTITLQMKHGLKVNVCKRSSMK